MSYEFLMIATKIFINSSHLFIISVGTSLPVASRISNQYLVSSASFKAIPNLFLKSFVLTPLCASLVLAPILVPLFYNWEANSKSLFFFSLSVKWTISQANWKLFTRIGLLFRDIILSLYYYVKTISTQLWTPNSELRTQNS